MYFTLMGKLSARRQNLTEDKDKGFTLIELLVVVIIIGILAAIAIPVYLGVQNNAKDSSVKNDLTNAKTAVISVQTNTGKLPAAGVLDPANADLKAGGLTKGDNSGDLTMTVGGTTAAPTFCISSTSTATSKTYATSDVVGTAEGTCSSSGVFTKKA
ncbi:MULTISPECIES: type II secretion system protein [unclassified Frigoribacterium]|uniref:type II secretion system protein n=1 Tax=unclassified Frigoribacterium TaxID=2627005 RepID=UPI0012F3A311|nr:MULTISPECIES: prepilin-type N-terminal cleavage/methylation domain-containing protein [unclassified Frigoribacterium]VXB84949.1 conserved hypothetical protein [Frigoribacterium sp. 9N]